MAHTITVIIIVSQFRIWFACMRLAKVQMWSWASLQQSCIWRPHTDVIMRVDATIFALIRLWCMFYLVEHLTNSNSIDFCDAFANANGITCRNEFNFSPFLSQCVHLINLFAVNMLSDEIWKYHFPHILSFFFLSVWHWLFSWFTFSFFFFIFLMNESQSIQSVERNFLWPKVLLI